jgi:hypothetical protein
MWNVSSFHTIHAREAGAGFELGREFLELCGFAGGHCLDSAIRQVADPPSKAQALPVTRGEPSKADALHFPGDEPASCSLSHR